jgi:uncharacterized phage-associated protein
MKLFYFLDFIHVKNYGSPVTNDCYINLEHGPIPTTIKNLVDSVDNDIDNAVLSDVIKINKIDGENMHRVEGLRNFSERDAGYLSDNQIKILKKICIRFGDSNMREIEKAAHEETPWRETSLLDKIPYSLAAKDDDCLVEEETIKLLSDVE